MVEIKFSISTWKTVSNNEIARAIRKSLLEAMKNNVLEDEKQRVYYYNDYKNTGIEIKAKWK